MRDEASKNAVKSFFSSFLSYFAIGMAVFLALFAIFSILGFKTIRVDGHSMDPTLHSGEIIIMKAESPKKRGDIAVLEMPKAWKTATGVYNQKSIIKRIHGIPGDTVKYSDGKVSFVSPSGKAVETLELNYPIDCRITHGEKKLSNDEYFIMGDNRSESFDSMYAWCNNLSFIVQGSNMDISGKVLGRD